MDETKTYPPLGTISQAEAKNADSTVRNGRQNYLFGQEDILL